jgi:pimeloyl-ACP methyl ester carboxylesterase
VKARRAAVLAGSVGVGMAAAGGALYALERRTARRWRVDGEALVAAGRSLPTDLEHRFVGVDDGGRIHVVERGRGTPIVLVHGVTLGVAAWAPQLRNLTDGHRVVAVSQRGHGQSMAGEDGYSFERMADDLAEVLEALDIEHAVLVGHSMGGMVAQTLAARDPAEFRRRTAALVLVATSAGPLMPTSLGATLGTALAGGAGQSLRVAERRGRGLMPGEDLGAWITRASFGARPDPHDLELTRSMIAAMSPSAMAGLMGPLLRFDLHREIAAIEVPTTVVVGTRDLLTPPRMARAMAATIPGATLVEYPGCGHMVMLERAEEFNDLLEGVVRRSAASRN